MIDRLETQEVYPGRRAERIAIGTALLTLGEVLPAYRCIGLEVDKPDRFQALLREAVAAKPPRLRGQPRHRSRSPPRGHADL